jgi:hypothetical protein
LTKKENKPQPEQFKKEVFFPKKMLYTYTKRKQSNKHVVGLDVKSNQWLIGRKGKLESIVIY